MRLLRPTRTPHVPTSHSRSAIHRVDKVRTFLSRFFLLDRPPRSDRRPLDRPSHRSLPNLYRETEKRLSFVSPFQQLSFPRPAGGPRGFYETWMETRSVRCNRSSNENDSRSMGLQSGARRRSRSIEIDLCGPIRISRLFLRPSVGNCGKSGRSELEPGVSTTRAPATDSHRSVRPSCAIDQDCLGEKREKRGGTLGSSRACIIAGKPSILLLSPHYHRSWSTQT